MRATLRSRSFLPLALLSVLAAAPTAGRAMGGRPSERAPARAVKVVALRLASEPVFGGTTATGIVVLDAVAPLSGLVVTLAITTGRAPVTIPATVTVPGGASQVRFPIATQAVGDDVLVGMTASGSVSGASFDGSSNTTIAGETAPAPVSLAFVVRAYKVLGVTSDPPSVFGGLASPTVTVLLNGAAPPAGLAVALRSSIADVVVPATVTVPGGRDRLGVPVQTRAVAAAIAARIDATPVRNTLTQTTTTQSITDGTSNTIQVGETSTTPTLHLFPVPQLTALGVSPAELVSGGSVTLALAFAAVAVPTGVPLPVTRASLASGQPALIALPPTVDVTAGALQVSVQRPTTVVTTDQTVQLSATLAGVTRTASVRLLRPVPVLGSVEIRPLSVKGGSDVSLSLRLVSGATVPAVVTLLSSRPDLLPVPATVTVAPGQAGTEVTVRAAPTGVSTPVTVTASVGGDRLTAVVTVRP